MSSQVERGTLREMVHTIAFRAGVLERILQEPVLGSLEIRTDELAHVQLLQRQIDDLRRYLSLPSVEPERTAKVKTVEKPNVFKCSECGQYMHSTSWGSPVEYCSRCGCRLEWE